MARGITQVRIPVPLAMTAYDRNTLAVLVVDIIKIRTRSGQDIYGNNFKSYNRDYLENLRDDGIEKQTPNLDVTGDMLEGIEYLDEGPGFILIGIDKSNTLAYNKARWNQGQNPKIPSRPFMGIPANHVEALTDIILSFRSQATVDIDVEGQGVESILAGRVREQFELTDSIFDQLAVETPILEFTNIRRGFPTEEELERS